MKKIAKFLVVSVLGWQVRRLRRKNQIRIIGVAGSIGKTSTKLAIANVLNQKYKVRFQEGNYNDLSTVPLIFFGRSLSFLFNPFAWLAIFLRNEAVIRRPYPYDFVVVELGTDGPGQIAEFKKYLRLDVAVVTSISPEHMEYFKTLDAVAEEELSVANFSDSLLINSDLCDKKYLDRLEVDHTTYGTGNKAEYLITNVNQTDKGFDFSIKKDDKVVLTGNTDSLARTQLFSIAAAVATGDSYGLSNEELAAGVSTIRPVSGRMRILKGKEGLTIIDDTYNASPDAAKEALDTLYRFDSPQRIAVLGSMNELGGFSKKAHEEVGNYCDPKQLKHLITIGGQANKYLAKAAEQKGCKVDKFDSPFEAGEYLKLIVKPDAVILAKGSQNGVFAEEAIKYILADSKDASKLVRQSRQWLKIKRKQFER